MLKLRDLQNFKEWLANGGWADAFQYAGEELRGEMIEVVEMLLDTADEADRVVGEVLFNKDGMVPAGDTASSIKEE